MARVDIPLPGKDKEYDSRKSRAILKNLMVQVNQDGSFKSIVKREGTADFTATTNADNIASSLYVGNDDHIYFVGRTNFYKMDAAGTVSDLGPHSFVIPSGNDGWRVISNNLTPNPQYMFFEDSQIGSEAAIWVSGTGITTVSDTDYTGKDPNGGAVVYGRFYFVNNLTSETEFFASGLLSGLTYDPLAIADADEESGRLLYIMAYKSSLWLFKTRNIEYWQTTDDATFPMRRILGNSRKIGLASDGQNNMAQLYDYIGFIGADHIVYLMEGDQVKRISDIDFTKQLQAIDGTTAQVQVFFVDGIDHRYFCVTASFSVPISTKAEFTWVYDLKTGQSHYRDSDGESHWAFMDGVVFGGLGSRNETIIRRAQLPTAADQARLYRMNPNLYDDSGTDFTCILQSGSLSFGEDVTIDHIEIEMETGVGNADSTDPEMVVSYSKDGGVSFTTHSTVILGDSTNQANRITLYSFGRLVRHTDFILKLSITEPVRVEFYGAYAEVSGGF